MNNVLGTLRVWGVLRDIDEQLVNSLVSLMAPDGLDEGVKLLLALTNRAEGEGHVCLPIDKMTAEWVVSLQAGDGVEIPGLEDLLHQALPAKPEKALAACTQLVGDGTGAQPFVLDNGKLYLRRFWCYERTVATRLLEMAAACKAVTPDAEQDGQKRAIAQAMTGRLTIITGGPGTGKTRTAAEIFRQFLKDGSGRRIRMAAPTGKAAARMDESVRRALATDLDLLPRLEPASTIDRLLGYREGSPYFRHDRDNPLDADMVLVDEASMIDLAKMAKLLDALKQDAKLVLLGDMNQLASVQPGSVMAELCSSSGLDACVVRLVKSWRFAEDSAIGRLSAAVNAGKADEAWQQITASGNGGKDAVVRHAHAKFRGGFPDSVRAGFRDFLAAREKKDVFEKLAQFRVLCALRRGPQGVEEINAWIRELLTDNPGAHRLGTGKDFYDHRVVMVTRNDYSLKLYNGDVGVVLQDPDRDNELAVYFEAVGGTFRRIPCQLLPEHETAFAITVHKSQGSEFGHVVVVLPDRDTPVVTRELIYTAITRTKGGVELWCEEAPFKKGVERRVERSMGLSGRMMQPVSGER